MHETTKEEFEQYIESVEYWCEVLGCTSYRRDFAHVPLMGALGRCTPDTQKRVCLFEFTSELSDNSMDLGYDPARIGRHEALHLFLADMVDLAHNGAPEWLVEKTEEALVRQLEHALGFIGGNTDEW